jgi:hypothetical protein
METKDARELLRAMEVLDVADRHDPAKVTGIVLTARTADQRPGPNNRPVSVMVTSDHPQWATVLSVLNGAVDLNKQAAEAKVAELGVERTIEIEAVR